MRGRVWMMLCAALVAGGLVEASPLEAAPKLRSDQIALWNDVRGPAAAALFRFAGATRIPCYVKGEETRCRLVDIVYKAAVYYADETAAKAALAVLWYSPDTGNALYFDVYLFRRKGEAFQQDHEVTGLIGSPSEAYFDGQRYIVTTQTLMPNDARCCPLGRTVWQVGLTDPAARYLSGYKDPDWKLP